MILYEIVLDENHPAYQDLSIDNLERQYSFLESIIRAALAVNRRMLSTSIIKNLNLHAIACLHGSAGEYRPCEVTVGTYLPPKHYRVNDLMNDFVNEVNYWSGIMDPVALATFVLWKVNHIHPFINGNGRTARALCYYIVCVGSGGLLRGSSILPELIRQNRSEYVLLLQEADRKYHARNPDFLVDLHNFLVRLLNEQLSSQ